MWFCFSEKIRQKQDQETDKHGKSSSKSLSAIEEFCEKFDKSVRNNYIKVRFVCKHLLKSPIFAYDITSKDFLVD